MPNTRLKLLGNYLRPHWQTVGFGILSLFLVNGIGVYIPLLIQRAIDDLQITFTITKLEGYALQILVWASAMLLIRMVSRILIFGIGRQVEFDLKQTIFAHLLTLEPSYFNTITIGDLINRATSDVDSIRRLLGFGMLSLANILFAYGLTLPLMVSIHWQLTLAAISVYPVMMGMVQLFSDRLRHEQQAVQQTLSDLSELVQEDISGIGLIKIYAQEENERQAFQTLNQQLMSANLDMALTRNLLFPLLGGLASLSFLVLLWLGGSEIANGTISIGNFVALLLYVERLVFPTALLGFTITTYQRAEVSIDRVEGILQVQPHIQDTPSSIPLPSGGVQGELTARHLTYTYPGASTPALNDINFTIRPGEKVAIVGPIGSGKSTLANAIPRLLDIDPGQLFLDQTDITQITLGDLRQAIAYVPQESLLFSATVQDNIRYGDPVTGLNTVTQLAKQAHIHDEILNFPKQYDTLVGERGITLSGGQRQRTALARAFLVDSPILLLDDALSSVDNHTASKILQQLSSGHQRKTIIFISHQLSAAATADRILVMHHGEIVQSGSHARLSQEPGLYQSLWRQQQLSQDLG